MKTVQSLGLTLKKLEKKLLTTCVVEATISVTYSYFFFPSVQEVECEDHHQFPVPWCGWERGPQQFVWSGFGASRQQRGTSLPPNKSSYKVVLTSFFPVFKQAFVLWPGVFNLLPGLQQLSRTPGTRGAPSARVQPAVFRCKQLYAPHTQPNTLMFLTLFPLTGISNRATVSPPPLSLCVFLCSDIKLLSIYRSHHPLCRQKLYLMLRGACLACHMLTCPRAPMHLLLSQLKLVDHGAMREVYMAEHILNQVGDHFYIGKSLTCSP